MQREVSLECKLQGVGEDVVVEANFGNLPSLLDVVGVINVSKPAFQVREWELHAWLQLLQRGVV